jgi:hypothetical protein
MGLKLGIYTSGKQCCSPKDGTDGSEGKELEDAQQFADWGIDCSPTLSSPYLHPFLSLSGHCVHPFLPIDLLYFLRFVRESCCWQM